MKDSGRLVTTENNISSNVLRMLWKNSLILFCGLSSMFIVLTSLYIDSIYDGMEKFKKDYWCHFFGVMTLILENSKLKG